MKHDANRLLFRSVTLEEVRDEVAAAYKPHRLDMKANAGLDARMHSLSLGQVKFNRLKYGADVRINPEHLEQFYLIQMPVCGFADISRGEDRIACDARLASVLNPTEPLSMRWSGDCDMLMFRIEREAVERACAQQLGQPLHQPLSFKPELNWQADPAWSNMMLYLTRLLQECPAAAEQLLIRQQLEQLVVNTLLAIQPHSYTERMNQPHQTLAPRYVKRVEEYIESHAAEALTPGQLAELAGVSIRTLYAGFHDFRQTSPMEHLRQIRLRKVKNTLEQQAERISVTDAALSWGFTHMGRFSREYQRTFGEKPSDTRRRSLL
ncbi:AraC family transcriptional regulator [Marinobacterium ramblicola]|uniref:AraC family transcriptional regulator n=1 Tax=Marinobacterium ramblicola TaxID=2849041 RepID=UPI001C2D0364|nr:AraC family transcriptional regulator [Marinobacterium ramblicola]